MKFPYSLKITIFYFSISALILPIFVFADENLEESCKLDNIEKQCQTLGQTECRKILEKCEKYYEDQSAKIEADITKTAKEKKTLQNKISELSKKVKSLESQINQSNLIIKDLKIQVEDTSKSIEKTSLKIEDSKEKLSNIIRTIHEEDQKPLVEILFSESELSDFFDNLANLEILNNKNKELLQNIKLLKLNLQQQKGSLDDEKDNLEKVVKVQTLQKQESTTTKKEQEYYLNITEQEYQKQVKEKKDVEKITAEIRARLFRLIGVAKAPTFGEALEIAKNVASIFNIRPSFLLAIISQESAIGRNVGQCTLTNPATGEGKRISSGAIISKVMKPTRDVQPFLKITADLGKDPYNTPVSCPLSVGWGGAMGPAQFIPSTWNLYYDRLQNVLGRPADPWGINDSFTAAGLYLSDLGASAKTADKETSAASRYYGGSSVYARGVMTRATCIQNFIDLGTMSSECESLIF